MIFLIRRKTVLYCALVLSVFTAICICGILHERQNEAKSVLAVPISGKLVVIDAGHGGFDAGASANGLDEKDVNLSVAEYLKEYIAQGGGIPVMTRTEDVSTADADTKGLSAKKSDLVNRKALAEKSEADAFVSIHMNKFPQPQYKGAQVFYGDKPESGKVLGEEIQSALIEIIQDGNQRQAKKTDGGIFILKNTQVPSVIVECGFLSNSDEAALLKQDSYRQKLAWAIYVGIVRFFGS